MLIASFGVFIYVEKNINENEQLGLVIEETITVKTMSEILAENLKLIVNDLEYLKLNTLDVLNSGEDISELEKNWYYYVESKEIYDQVRYIDAYGDEKVRVNYNNGNTEIVEESVLQNKKDRYYYQETELLEDGQIYISKFDLNIENGEIEDPIKPMIRFATPIYGDDDKFLGIVIINFLGESIIGNIEKEQGNSQGTLSLINNEGYWIYSDSPSKNWGFMYENRKDFRFGNEFSDEWELLGSDSGNVKSESGLFTYSTIKLDEKIGSSNKFVFGDGNWTLISYVKADENNYYLGNNLYQILLRVIDNNNLYFFLTIIASYLVAVLLSKNRASYHEIKYLSEYDGLTGVYNRRAGLNLLKKELLMNHSNLGIGFIDINGLKQVNDIIGHHAGDELILSVVKVLNNYIKDNELIMRLGGDEFLLLLNEKTIDEVEKLFEEVNQSIDDINKKENRKYNISISYGLMDITNQDYINIDELIMKADEKMYEQKEKLRGSIEIIKPYV